MVIAKDAPSKLDGEGEPNNEDQPLEDKLNLIVSNKAEYFDLLFELLNLGVPDITQAVWKLMMQVPINQKLFNSMRSLQTIQAAQVDSIVEAEARGWQAIIDPNSPYKMLYSLQILNTLVSVNNQLLSDLELQERHEWRQRFLELGGFTHLYMILITSDVAEMLSVCPAASLGPPEQSLLGKKMGAGLPHQQRQLKKSRSKLIKSSLQSQIEAAQARKGQGNKVDQARCLSYLISIVKIFLHAALLTVDYENLLSLVVQSSTSPFRNDRKKTAHSHENDPKALE